MNGFLIGFLSTLALFAFSFVISAVIVKVFLAPRRKKEEKSAQNVVYYLSEAKPRPKKPKPIAIKGTLLSAEELNALLGEKRKK